jgi:aryl sulfotransferase
VPVPEERWDALVEAATFVSMRGRATQLTPDTLGVLKDRAAFFRTGRSGTGRAVMSADELALYEARVARMVSPDLVAWLHR